MAREAGFLEYFDGDNLTLRHGDEELYTQLEDSQWPPSTDEATAADDIDELKSKLIDTFVQYLDERFEAFSVQPLSRRRVFDTRLWPRERSDMVSFGEDDFRKLVEHFSVFFTNGERQKMIYEWKG